MTRFYLLVFSFFLLPCLLFSQSRQLNYQAEIGGGPSSTRLPFWLHTNTRGTISPDTYLWGNVGLITPFAKSYTRAFDYSFGAEGTGALGKDDNKIFINQLFGRVRWQNLVLSVGMVDRPTLYDGLSASNGNMLYSNNTRNMPGISIASWDYIKLPWIGRWVSFKFKYAEYMMLDDRYTKNAHVHDKLLAGKLTIIPQLSIEAGIEDYGQWGGKNPQGKIHYSLKDYARMVLIKGGSDEASLSDQINKLGNHIGMHFARLNINTNKFDVSLYYNHIFEDGSGMKYKNRPDGLYGIYFTRKQNTKWFKSLVYEFYYTKSQSGPNHDRPATPEEMEKQDPSSYFYGRVVMGGNDNYLNHGEYRSGWSLYGQMIGSPFFTPKEPIDGIITGTYNNRFYAHHLGICGDIPLWEMQYKLMCSYSQNFGTHGTPFYNQDGERISKPQFSFGLKLTVPEKEIPFGMALNLGFDKGDLLRNNFGMMLSIFKTGIF